MIQTEVSVNIDVTELMGCEKNKKKVVGTKRKTKINN
jgi:hypothetical protein